MGLTTLGMLATFVGSGLYARYAPTGLFGFDLWGWLMATEPQPYLQILRDNVLLWMLVFGGATLLLYPPWTAIGTSGGVAPAALARFKLNAAPPRRALMYVEFLRSLRGLAVGAALEYAYHRAHSAGRLDALRDALCPVALCGAAGAPMVAPDDVAWWAFLGGAVFAYLGGDAHFYWTHRLLHTRCTDVMAPLQRFQPLTRCSILAAPSTPCSPLQLAIQKRAPHAPRKL